MRIGDRIAIMKDGQVMQVGTPEEILRSPANDYVRSFVRGVDAAAVFKAGDIARKSQIVVCENPERGSRAALSMLEDQDRAYAYVVQSQQALPGRGVGRFAAQRARRPFRPAGPAARLPAGPADASMPRARWPACSARWRRLPYALPVVANDGASAAPSARPPC
jgi:glycine betaine/proline transport system ATP-binding protein